MLDFGTKTDGGAGASGQLTADEFNNYIDELENAVTRSGNSLDATGTDLVQLSQAIATGGRIVALVDMDTAEVGDIVLPDNSAGSLTINLPATPFTGAMVYFRQVFGQSFETNSVTIGRNGNTINGASVDVTVASPDAQFSFFFDGATWVMIFGSYIGVVPDAPPRLAGIPVAMGFYTFKADPSGSLVRNLEFGVTNAVLSGDGFLVTLDHTASATGNWVAFALPANGVLTTTIAADFAQVSTNSVGFALSANNATPTSVFDIFWGVWDLAR